MGSLAPRRRYCNAAATASDFAIAERGKKVVVPRRQNVYLKVQRWTPAMRIDLELSKGMRDIGAPSGVCTKQTMA
jgi:hypothetical protein